MEEEKKKSFIAKHKMSIFVAVSAVVMLIGLSYAWLQLTLRGTKDLTLRAGNLSLVLDDSMEGGISMDSVVPVADEEGKSQDGYTFTLENNGSIASQYTIYLDDLALDEGQTKMDDAFIKMSLTKENQEEVLLLSQTIVDGKKVLDLGNIDAGSKYTYNLKMWIDENATKEIMGTVFKGQLRIEASQVLQTGLAIDQLISKANFTGATYDQSSAVQQKEMFSFSHGAGEQQAGWSEEELTDYRYVGLNPRNYVIFNDEVWRIVGVFTVEDESGQKERRLKLVRNELLGNYSFNNKGENGENDWTTSSLQQVLNSGAYYNRTGGYTTNGLTEEAKSYIADAKWYLGGTGSYDNSSNGLVSHFYNYERGNTVYSGRSISWIGKIGLIYVSDYGYATSGGTTKNRQTCLNNSLVSWDGRFDTDCWNNNWLYYSGSQWVMNSSSSDGYKVFHLRVNGIVNDTVYNAKDLVMMRPAIYLKTDISLTGEGTSTSPYEIE